MRFTLQLVKRLLVVIATFSLISCTFRPHVGSAHVKKGTEGNEIVEVVLFAADAKKIKENEIYFSLVVVDCKSDKRRAPTEPYIGGKLASNFDFLISGESVEVEGRLPERVFDEYPTPCVTLQGGNYMFQRINSMPVPIVRLPH